MICLPICGDNVREPGLEEFDDGCYNCQLECDTRCKKCYYGQCKDICKLNELEIENDWNCFRMNTQVNQCFSITQESLEYLNQTKYCQYVQLYFSKKVILANNSEVPIISLQKIHFKFQDCNQMNILQTAIQKFLFLKLNLEIFDMNTKYILTTKQTLNETILDENGMVLSPTNISIELKVPKILTRSQLTISKALKTVGHSIMISLSCGSFSMLLLGMFLYLIQLLDILQQKQFLKYLNFEYPQNVYIYFESSNFVTLQSLLNQINFPDFYQNIFSQEFQQSICKMQEYQINADFLTNIETFIFQILVGCTFCLSLYLYEKYISKLISLLNIFHFIEKSISKLLESIFIQLYKYKRKYLDIQKTFQQ